MVDNYIYLRIIFKESDVIEEGEMKYLKELNINIIEELKKKSDCWCIVYDIISSLHAVGISFIDYENKIIKKKVILTIFNYINNNIFNIEKEKE